MQIVHLVDKEINPEKYEEPDPAFRFNEDYLIELIPEIEKMYIRSKENGGDSIQWRVNQDGFRGSELKDHPEFRIMVYGDSNVQARFSEEESTYVFKLGGYLRSTSTKEIEVINAGIVGFGPDQSLLKFEQEVDKYKPDLVILNVFAGNDYGDIIRNRLLELDMEGNLVETLFEKEEDQELRKEDGFKIRIWEWAKSIKEGMGEKKNARKAIQNPEAYEEGVFNYFDRVNKEAFEIYKKGKPRLFSHFQDSYETDVATDPDSESSQRKVLLMKAVLKKMNEVALEKGVQFVIQIQPSATDLTPSNYVLGNKYLQKKFPRYRKEGLTHSLSEIAEELQIPSLNLYSIFMGNNPEALFFKGENNHWNDAGQRLAAASMAEFIADSLWNR